MRQVSVVIPCYNQERFLGEAIESALGQEGCGPVEVVVVDDGSADATAEVATRYIGVKYIRQANAGLAAARNRGLAESGGEYVVFLDADDRLLPEALRVGVAALDARPDLAFVSGHYSLIDADGSLISAPPPSRCPEDDHYFALLQRNYIGMNATVMYRRSILEFAGGFAVSRRACEDYDLYLRIARRFLISCHHTVIAEYRQHGGNMSKDCNLMMKSSISVLRAQWTSVRGDKRLKHAYRAGITWWRDYYAKGLINQAKSDFKSRNLKRLTNDLLTLLQYHPRGFFAKGGLGLIRKVVHGLKLTRNP
jgi:glycosyltransferase involved in cell wall biosynthesis